MFAWGWGCWGSLTGKPGRLFLSLFRSFSLIGSITWAIFCLGLKVTRGKVKGGQPFSSPELSLGCWAPQASLPALSPSLPQPLHNAGLGWPLLGSHIETQFQLPGVPNGSNTYTQLHGSVGRSGSSPGAGMGHHCQANWLTWGREKWGPGEGSLGWWAQAPGPGKFGPTQPTKPGFPSLPLPKAGPPGAWAKFHNGKVGRGSPVLGWGLQLKAGNNGNAWGGVGVGSV